MHGDGRQQEIDHPGKKGQQSMDESAKRKKQQHHCCNSRNMGVGQRFAEARCHTVTVGRYYRKIASYNESILWAAQKPAL